LITGGLRVGIEIPTNMHIGTERSDAGNLHGRRSGRNVDLGANRQLTSNVGHGDAVVAARCRNQSRLGYPLGECAVETAPGLKRPRVLEQLELEDYVPKRHDRSLADTPSDSSVGSVNSDSGDHFGSLAEKLVAPVQDLAAAKTRRGAETVRSIRRPTETEWKQLYRDERAALVRTALLIAGSPATAEDVFHTAMERVRLRLDEIDLPVGEIADLLGCAHSSASSLLHRGLADLRKELSDD